MKLQEAPKDRTGRYLTPQILLGHIRDIDGNITHVAMTDFVPGKVIERLGRRYQLMPDGSQRRMK